MRRLGDSQGVERARRAGQGTSSRGRDALGARGTAKQPPDTALAPAGGTGSAGSHPAPHCRVAQGSPALWFAEARPAFITKLKRDELPG